MKTAKDFRRAAWTALGEGQYWPFVGAQLVLMLIMGLMLVPWFGTIVAGAFMAKEASDMSVGLMASVALAGMLCAVPIMYGTGFVAWGTVRMSLAVGRREMKFGLFSSGWGHGWKMLWVTVVHYTYLQLWLLLLVVPGVIKAFSYALTEYVAVDHPGWTANQCITESRRLMDGHRWRLFCLGISFIGWWLLVFAASMLPCGGMAQFFLAPYQASAIAAFYEDRKAEAGIPMD